MGDGPIGVGESDGAELAGNVAAEQGEGRRGSCVGRAPPERLAQSEPRPPRSLTRRRALARLTLTALSKNRARWTESASRRRFPARSLARLAAPNRALPQNPPRERPKHARIMRLSLSFVVSPDHSGLPGRYDLPPTGAATSRSMMCRLLVGLALQKDAGLPDRRNTLVLVLSHHAW
jgi:hypothetical protein